MQIFGEQNGGKLKNYPLKIVDFLVPEPMNGTLHDNTVNTVFYGKKKVMKLRILRGEAYPRFSRWTPNAIRSVLIREVRGLWVKTLPPPTCFSSQATKLHHLLWDNRITFYVPHSVMLATWGNLALPTHPSAPRIKSIPGSVYPPSQVSNSWIPSSAFWRTFTLVINKTLIFKFFQRSSSPSCSEIGFPLRTPSLTP